MNIETPEYYDCNGNKILAGMTLTDGKGYEEEVLLCGDEDDGYDLGINRVTADNFNIDHCLRMIEEDYRFVMQLESSTNPVDNVVENYRTLGKQKFIRSTQLADTPLNKIEAAVRKYAEVNK